MWDLPRPGLEPVSPALTGRFLTTVPPGKPLCLTFWGGTKLLSTAAVPLYISSSNVQGFLCLHILINSCYFLVSDYSHPSEWKVVSRCGFDLNLPDDLCCWAVFHMLTGHLDCFFWEISIQVLWPFTKLCCLSSYSWAVKFLYIFCITIPLSNIWFANIFSHV